MWVKMVIVRMVKPIDKQVVGDDGQAYGPFEAGQNYFVPERLAEAMVYRGFAEVV